MLLAPDQPLLDRLVFYLLFYGNSTTNARRALKSFLDTDQFVSWNEVRVATEREIAEVLTEAKVAPADFLAPRLKQLLQAVFEEADETQFEPLLERINEPEKAAERKKITDELRKWAQDLPGIPPWAQTYVLVGLGLEKTLPWDPHTEAVLEELKLLPAKSTLAQKKRIAKALIEGLPDDLGPLEVHHLLVEYVKKGTKK
ncbi:MAG: hypothetical protein KDD82_08105 [Planctomycetes bacterium]|nr:hypothetical protein [Planctomycetota bacterium]